jgi:transcription termination/antitermination protein NusG
MYMTDQTQTVVADNQIDKQWYIVSTYSSHENKVADNLKRRIDSMNLQAFIFRIVVVEQDEPVFKDGSPTGKVKKKNSYPGYVFIEMIMTDESWYMVRNTPGVTGFVGSSGGGTKPIPVPPEQMEPILKRMGMIDEGMYARYEVNDLVKVMHGPLEGSEGKIISINKQTGVVNIETVFFGRATTVDVDFSEIEKI